jgi:hypothetical protein
MKLSPIVKREVEVAFSKHAQPIWFRIVKYIVLGGLFYVLWATPLLWIILGIIFVVSLALHFWYRHKTQRWTKSYGMWNYEKNKSADRAKDVK